VQWELHSSPRSSVRLETAVSNIEQVGGWQFLSSAVRHLRARNYRFLRDRRKQKWIWAILIALASYQSYFVRQLVVALFFFTILYAILAALVVLYILMVDALDRVSVSVESLGRSFLSSARHHFALPARVPSLPKDRAVHRIQKLGPN
jgi:hypothetical protein